jgi:hypothetical protein
MIAGVALLVAMWVFLMHSVHPGVVIVVEWRTAMLREFGPVTVVALVFVTARPTGGLRITVELPAAPPVLSGVPAAAGRPTAVTRPGRGRI